MEGADVQRREADALVAKAAKTMAEAVRAASLAKMPIESPGPERRPFKAAPPGAPDERLFKAAPPRVPAVKKVPPKTRPPAAVA